ncbi:rhodanese-like domain-containing protein [Pararhodobacter marinus]
MFNLFSAFMGGTAAVDPAEAVAAVGDNRALLIDVREEAETRSGMARGALNLPLSRLHLAADPASGHHDTRLAAARKAGKPLYLYCASGARSGRAAGILKQHGFPEVHNLGNLGAWQRGGGAVLR